MIHTKKLGKRPFKYDPRTLQFHKYSSVLDTLPVPAAVHYPNPSPLGMLLNSELGDCVPAARLHHKMVQLYANGIVWLAPNTLALSDYEAVGGYVPGNPATDQGCSMLDMMNYLVKKGAIRAFCQVNMQNQIHVKQAIYTFGGIEIGWALPACLDENSTMWTPPTTGLTGSGTPGSLGGHATYAPGYNARAIDNITWGERIGATWDFVSDYSDEGWVLVTDAWIGKDKESPSGFNITQLLADQAMVTG
jgi:hypothetical protein